MSVEDVRSPSRMRGWARAILVLPSWELSVRGHPLSASCIYFKRERYSRYSKAASSAFFGHPRGFSRGRVHVMNIGRTNESINKAEDAGRIDAQIGFADALRRVFPTTVASYSRFMVRFAKRQQGTGRTNCRLADVLPSDHVLDASASMASIATFGGFCCGQYLAAVTTTVAYGTGVGRTQLRNTAVKVNGRLPFKVCQHS